MAIAWDRIAGGSFNQRLLADSLAAFPALGSAESDSVETLGIGSLTLKDGLIDNSQQYKINTDIDGDLKSKIKSRGEQIVTQIDMKQGIRELNEAKRKGHVKFTEKDGVVRVGLTDAGRKAAEKVLEQIHGEVGAQHHGINDYEENPIAVPPNIKAWTDDPTTEAIVLGTTTAGTLIPLGRGLRKRPSYHSWYHYRYATDVISTVNDGHGVRFKFNVVPVPPIPSVVPTLKAQ